MERTFGTKLGRAILVLMGAGVLYLGVAWLVTMNSGACWYPWHDVLPDAGHHCGLGM